MKRITSIDALRNFANITRCFIHASIPYMVTQAPIWPVDDKGSWFFDFVVFENHLFVMELFFTISGFIFAIQMNLNPTRKVVANILKRILLPFSLGLLIIVPVVLSLFSLSQFPGFTFFDFQIIQKSYLSGWNLAFENFFPTAHLWYLYYLFIFYLFTLLVKNYFSWSSSISVSRIVLLGISISTTCMFFMDRWLVENPLTMLPEIPSLLHFYFFFVLGMVIYNSPRILDNLKKNNKRILALGILFAVAAVIPQVWFGQIDLHYYLFIKVIAVVLYCSASHLLVLGLLGVFTSYPIRESKLLRYFTDASYWIYLSNMPIVALFQIALIPVEISVYYKFLISFFGALMFSLLSYELLVRYTMIGKILNKKRKRHL
jgi:glucan biosynthesis protein C